MARTKSRARRSKSKARTKLSRKAKRSVLRSSRRKHTSKARSYSKRARRSTRKARSSKRVARKSRARKSRKSTSRRGKSKSRARRSHKTFGYGVSSRRGRPWVKKVGFTHKGGYRRGALGETIATNPRGRRSRRNPGLTKHLSDGGVITVDGNTATLTTSRGESFDFEGSGLLSAVRGAKTSASAKKALSSKGMLRSINPGRRKGKGRKSSSSGAYAIKRGSGWVGYVKRGTKVSSAGPFVSEAGAISAVTNFTKGRKSKSRRRSSRGRNPSVKHRGHKFRGARKSRGRRHARR